MKKQSMYLTFVKEDGKKGKNLHRKPHVLKVKTTSGGKDKKSTNTNPQYRFFCNGLGSVFLNTDKRRFSKYKNRESKSRNQIKLKKITLNPEVEVRRRTLMVNESWF